MIPAATDAFIPFPLSLYFHHCRRCALPLQQDRSDLASDVHTVMKHCSFFFEFVFWFLISRLSRHSWIISSVFIYFCISIFGSRRVHHVHKYTHMNSAREKLVGCLQCVGDGIRQRHNVPCV